MKALLWTRQALRDREVIYDYIDADKPIAAAEMDDLFRAKAELLRASPLLGKEGRVTDTREWVVHANYMLVYDLRDDQIRVLRVLHVARQWPRADD